LASFFSKKTPKTKTAFFHFHPFPRKKALKISPKSNRLLIVSKEFNFVKFSQYIIQNLTLP